MPSKVTDSLSSSADSVNEFFDSLFESIDYSLLLIFLGTFIVIANIGTPYP